MIAAFASFCQGVDAGQFGRLDDRNDLWQVLVVLTEAKPTIRNGGIWLPSAAGGESAANRCSRSETRAIRSTPGISRIADRGPTPEFAAEAIDQLRALLHALQDDTLRQLAIAKLEARSNEEIARQLGISLRSVERRLGLIRQIWREGLA